MIRLYEADLKPYDTCVMCDVFALLGPELGWVYYDNGSPAPVCSDACAEAFWAVTTGSSSVTTTGGKWSWSMYTTTTT